MKKLYYDVSKCLACKACEIACAVSKSVSKELLRAIFEEAKSLPCIKVKAKGEKNFPIACRHCKLHPCVDACIAKALTYDKTEKIVVYNKDRCVGCWMCVMVCPYGAIRDNKKLKVPIRCDLCKDFDEPQCLKACPVGAILFLEEQDYDKLVLAKKK